MKLKCTFILLISILLLSGCSSSPFGWYKINVVTPAIYNQKDADSTCPLVCEKQGAKWSGVWFNKKQSGCECLRKQCAPNCVVQFEPGTIDPN